MAYVTTRIEAIREMVAALDRALCQKVESETRLREAADHTLHSILREKAESEREMTSKREKADDYVRAQQNEWRNSLKDLSDTMASHAELSAIEQRVGKMEITVSTIPDRMDIDRRFKEVQEIGSARDGRIQALEQTRASFMAAGTERRNMQQTSMGIWGIVIAIVAVVASIVTSVVVHNSLSLPGK